jgi:predicted DNA-binding transcriptional regulator AlpA
VPRIPRNRGFGAPHSRRVLIIDKSARLNVQPESTTDQEMSMNRQAVQPRLLRLRDAPRYLGMDKNRFNREVRPWVTVIPIGSKGVAFDRLDLDAWVDEYKCRNGRPPAHIEGTRSSELPERQDSSSVGRFGISKRSSEERAFERAVQRAMSPKARRNSRRG